MGEGGIEMGVSGGDEPQLPGARGNERCCARGAAFLRRDLTDQGGLASGQMSSGRDRCLMQHIFQRDLWFWPKLVAHWSSLWRSFAQEHLPCLLKSVMFNFPTLQLPGCSLTPVHFWGMQMMLSVCKFLWEKYPERFLFQFILQGSASL